MKLKSAETFARAVSTTERYSLWSRCTRSPVEPSPTKPEMPDFDHFFRFSSSEARSSSPWEVKGEVNGRLTPRRFCFSESSFDTIVVTCFLGWLDYAIEVS